MVGGLEYAALRACSKLAHRLVVSVFVAMLYNPPEHRPSPVFFIGILMAAAGAGLVLAYLPS